MNVGDGWLNAQNINNKSTIFNTALVLMEKIERQSWHLLSKVFRLLAQLRATAFLLTSFKTMNAVSEKPAVGTHTAWI